MRIALALVILLSTSTAFAADACRQQIPPSLDVALSKDFPKFRAPEVTDNLQEDNEYNLKRGGTGCIAVASGDFNGDGFTDFIIGLTERNGPGGLVVVALGSGMTWQLVALSKWKNDRMRLFVGIEKSGVYTRTGALQGPLAKDEVARLVCRNTLPVFGMTDSTEVAYCYVRGNWKHVWISD